MTGSSNEADGAGPGGEPRRSGDAPAARRVREGRGLDRRADRHDLVGVHPVERRGAEKGLDAPTNDRHPRRASDEDRPVELARREPRQGEGVLGHLEGALEERFGHPLELGAREAEGEIEVRASHAKGDFAEVDLRLLLRGERHLHLLGRLPEALERLAIAPRIEAVLDEEAVGHAVGDGVVDVVASEEGIAGGGEHLEDVPVQVEERCVEGATAEVVDGDPLLAPLAEPVRQRRRRRLVEDAKDLEPGDPAGHFRRRPLELVEVRRHGDDGALDALAQRRLGDLARPTQDERADFRQRVLLAAGDDEGPLPRALLHLEGEAPARLLELGAVPCPPEQALHAGDRVLGVDGAPRLGVVPDEDVAARVKAHHAREEPPPLLVPQDVNTTAADARDDRIRSPEIDAYDRHGPMKGNITRRATTGNGFTFLTFASRLSRSGSLAGSRAWRRRTTYR